MPPGTGLSTNAMDSSLKKDPDLIASGKAWADRAWKDSFNCWPMPLQALRFQSD